MTNGSISQEKVHYLGTTFTATPAQGVSGTIIKSADDSYHFRVYHSDGGFTDYQLRHDDLLVTISPDEMASFYSDGERDILDHSPQVLGLSTNNGKQKNDA